MSANWLSIRKQKHLYPSSFNGKIKKQNETKKTPPLCNPYSKATKLLTLKIGSWSSQGEGQDLHVDGTSVAFPPVPSSDALPRSGNAALRPSIKRTFIQCHHTASSDDTRWDSSYSQRTQRRTGWEKKTCNRCIEVLRIHPRSKAMRGYIRSSQCQLLLWLLLSTSLLVSRTGWRPF